MTTQFKELAKRAVIDILVTHSNLTEGLPDSIARIQAERLVKKNFPLEKVIVGLSEKLDFSDETFERLEMFFNRFNISDESSRISVFFRSVYSIKSVNQYTALPTLFIEYFKELYKNERD